MREALLRLTSMLTAPRNTLLRVARRDEGDFFDVIVLLVAVRVLARIPALYKAVLLLPEAPGPVTRRFVNDLWTDLRHDVLVLCGAAFVVALIGRFALQPPIAARSAVTAAAYAGVPYVFLVAVSAAAGHLGLIAWWLPHHPVDAFYALVVDRQVSLVRYAVKCAIAYGPPLLLLVDALWQLRRGAAPEPALEPGRSVAPAAAKLALGASVAAAALLFSLGAGVWRTAAVAEQLRPLLPGDPLPDEVLPYLTGLDEGAPTGRLSLGSLKGQVVILDFWASWCAPCMRELPELSALQEKLGPRGLRVVGVNREPQDRTAAVAAWRRVKPSFETVVDVGAGTSRGLGEQVGIQSLPTTVIVDRQGIVRHLHLGYTEPEVFVREVEPLLAASAP